MEENGDDDDGSPQAPYHPPALLIGVELNGSIEDIDVVGGTPVLGVLELLVRVLDDPFPGAEEAAIFGGRGRRQRPRTRRHEQKKNKAAAGWATGGGETYSRSASSWEGG